MVFFEQSEFFENEAELACACLVYQVAHECQIIDVLYRFESVQPLAAQDRLLFDFKG